MANRGHNLESIKASIEARKPDFDAYIDPQKQYENVVIQVLPTQLIPDDILSYRFSLWTCIAFFS